jgi:hypothetical protein
METRSYTYPLERRVFHVDDECYIVYLGSSRDDYKPFLRIGNSRRLDEKVTPYIYTIVVTDSLTGDLLLEPRNINRKELNENRYVGSGERVERMLDFLKLYGLRTENIPHYREFTSEDQRAFLTMYDNGNMTLTYDGKQLFDLKKREIQDLHFVERAKRLKDQLRKNRCRYPASTFEKPGFFKIGNAVFVYAGGCAVAFGLPADYFQTLTSYGIDPDLIRSVLTDELTSDCINLCKRKQSRNEQLTFLTGKAPAFKSILALFDVEKAPDAVNAAGGEKTRGARAKGRSAPAADLPVAETPAMTVEELSASSESNSCGFTIKRMDKGYLVSHPSLAFAIRISAKSGSGSPKEFVVNPQRGCAFPPTGKKDEPVRVADGIPYELDAGPVESKTLVTRHFSELAGLLDGGLTAVEANTIEFIGKALQGAKEAGKDVSDAVEMVRKVIGDLKTVPSHPLLFLFHNVREISRFLSAQGAASRPMSELAGLMDRLVAHGDRFESHPPLVGGFYVSEKGAYVLYRLVKSSITKEDYALSRELVGETAGSLGSKATFFMSERERLSVHIGNLLAASLRRKKRGAETAQAEGPGVPGKGTPEAGTAADASGTAGKTGAVAYQPGSRAGSRTGKERHLVRTILIVVGAAVVAAAVLLIPPVSLLERSMEKMGLDSSWVPRMSHGPEQGLTDGETTGASSLEGQTSSQGPGGEAIQIPEIDRARIQELVSTSPVEISVLDIYKLVNVIASASGFRQLDAKTGRPGESKDLRDPNWIYPDDVLNLPEGTRRTVARGDTIWWVSAGFIKAQLDRDWERYQSLAGGVNKADPNDVSRVVAELETLKSGSFCGKFRRLVDNKVRELR